MTSLHGAATVGVYTISPTDTGLAIYASDRPGTDVLLGFDRATAEEFARKFEEAMREKFGGAK